MVPRFSPLLRTLSPPIFFCASMARAISRATALPLASTFTTISVSSLHPPSNLFFTPKSNGLGGQSLSNSLLFRKRCFHALFRGDEARVLKLVGGTVWAAGQRGYRKVRRRATAKSKQKELELNVSICIEEELPDDPEILVPPRFSYSLLSVCVVYF